MLKNYMQSDRMQAQDHSSLTYIGVSFPDKWLWGRYETQCIDSVRQQIQNKFSNKRNMLINLTWFGPQFNNNMWKTYQDFVQKKIKIDNLFLLSTVDPAMINPDQIQDMLTDLGQPRLFKIGNFDNEYHFNFFAPILTDHFKKYSSEDIELKSVKWLFINYNRKPRQHRVDFVKSLIAHDLKKYGLVTLGRPNVIYDKDPNNDLYLSLGEKIEDYIATGHWYESSISDEFGIPHDVLSLHNLDYWQNHFLHIIGATEFNHWDDIFVSETQFKPMLGLRPFLINGNPRTYKWLEHNGFRHFNKYWPNIDFNDPDLVHESLCRAIEFLTSQSETQITQMYHDIMPDLVHNQQRFYEFAREQKYKQNHLFDQDHLGEIDLK
jgi:hypothetical protein